MPFSRQNKALHGAITTISEPILDSAADEQTKMIGAVVAVQGLDKVLAEVSRDIYSGGREDWGHQAAFKKWRTTNKIEDLDSFKKLETALAATGLSEEAVSGVLSKVSEYITKAYGAQQGR